MTRPGAVLVAILALLARPARAQEDKAKDPALEEARQHVAKAKVHYDLGEFEQAEQPAEPAVKPAETPSRPPAVALATPANPQSKPASTTPAKPVPSIALAPATTHTVEKNEGGSHTVAWILAGSSVALLGGGGV